MKDLLKGIISEDELKELIADKVESVIEEEMTYQIKNQINEKIKTITKEKVDEILNEEIEKILKGPIVTNDGWGTIVRYESFEEMFKKEVRAQLDNYRFERILREQIEKKIKNIFKTELSGVYELIENTLLERFNLGGNKQ